MLTTLPVAIKIIIPATRTPSAKGKNAFFTGIFKKLAINEPTQAPVPGSGIATNKNRPKDAKVCNLLLPSIFLVAFSEAQSIIFLNIEILPKKSNNGLIYFTIKNIGIIFPINPN